MDLRSLRLVCVALLLGAETVIAQVPGASVATTRTLPSDTIRTTPLPHGHPMIKATGGVTPQLVDYLCASVYKKAEAVRPFRYEYEAVLWRLAGIVPGEDTRGSVRAKVQAMWSAHRDQLTCDTPTFRRANVVKLAIQNTFFVFVKDIVSRYQIDVNFIEAADGMSVLDYAVLQRDSAIRSGSSPEFVKELEDIVDALREWGAKRGSELSVPAR